MNEQIIDYLEDLDNLQSDLDYLAHLEDPAFKSFELARLEGARYLVDGVFDNLGERYLDEFNEMLRRREDE